MQSVFVKKPRNLKALKEGEDTVGCGSRAESLFRVKWKRSEPCGFHRLAEFTLDEGLYEDYDEVYVKQCFDSRNGLEPHRHEVIDGLQLLESFFQAGLTLVREKHLFRGHFFVVSD